MTFEEFLTKAWNEAGYQFEVDSPCQMTTSDSTGRFWKQGLIGQEMLHPFGAYVGKKGKTIIKAREAHDTERHYEMDWQEARQRLTGFAAHYDAMKSRYENRLTEQARELAAAKEEAADTQARRSADPLFGSW